MRFADRRLHSESNMRQENDDNDNEYGNVSLKVNDVMYAESITPSGFGDREIS